MTVLDVFAGAGGWSEALRMLGVPDVVGIELDPWACATAGAAGHKRIQADVSMVDLRDFSGVVGLVGSPPCPSFSPAGKGLGKLDLGRILAHTERIRQAGRWLHYSREGWHDPRSALVLEPLRYALTLRPDWVALEQVPPVLPIWQAIAGVLRDHGWHVETGLLTAEQFGVPQTRKRAILAARRCLESTRRPSSICTRARDLLPAPTHRKYRKGVDRAAGDQSLLPWVSMADALGWGPGVMAQAGMTSRMVEPRPTAAPAGTITGKGTAYVRFGNQPHSAIRSADEPAATLRFSERMNACDWIFARPAPTIVGTRRSSEGMLVGRQLGAEDERRDIGGWPDRDKPATTVQGDPRIAPRGHHDRQMNGAVRVTVQEAAVLQSFRPDYPWQGAPTKQYLAVGNAIPPLLAHAVLHGLIGP